MMTQACCFHPRCAGPKPIAPAPRLSNSAVPTLRLGGAFASLPYVEFGQIRTFSNRNGREAASRLAPADAPSKAVNLENTTDESLTVEIDKLPVAGTVFVDMPDSFTVEPRATVPVRILWAPTTAGSYRDSVWFKVAKTRLGIVVSGVAYTVSVWVVIAWSVNSA